MIQSYYQKKIINILCLQEKHFIFQDIVRYMEILLGYKQ
jgi:hypothetical protein